MKVLIVDDSSIIRKALSIALSQLGLEIVGEAKDGKSAIKLFDQTNPSLITMDITMPEMDGLSCMEEILKINKEVKVIVITALNDQSTALLALKKGAKAFLTKPFNPAKLLETIKMVIENET